MCICGVVVCYLVFCKKKSRVVSASCSSSSFRMSLALPQRMTGKYSATPPSQFLGCCAKRKRCEFVEFICRTLNFHADCVNIGHVNINSLFFVFRCTENVRQANTALNNWRDQVDSFTSTIPKHTYLVQGIPWSARRFPQGEALPLHSGWVDPCDHPKCGWLGHVIYQCGGLRSR